MNQADALKQLIAALDVRETAVLGALLFFLYRAEHYELLRVLAEVHVARSAPPRTLVRARSTPERSEPEQAQAGQESEGWLGVEEGGIARCS